MTIFKRSHSREDGKMKKKRKCFVVSFVVLAFLILFPKECNIVVAAGMEEAVEICTDGTMYYGAITSETTSNYYKFTLNSSGQVILNLSAGIDRIDCCVYDTLGNEIWKKRDIHWNEITKKSNTNEIIDLTKGTYYFAVIEHYGTGIFNFELSFKSAEESFSETSDQADNSIDTARVISLNTAYKGQIASNDNQDFYQFTLPSSGGIILDITAEIDRVKYYIYDIMGNEVWSKRDVHWNETTRKSYISEKIDLTKGTYFFAAIQYYGTGNYNFELVFTSAEESFTETSDDSDNSTDTAREISLGTACKGQIASNDDRDFYQFTLHSSGQIILDVSAEIDRVEYYIYDILGNEIWSRRNVHWNESTKKSYINEAIALTQGTYYFAVVRYYGTGNYSFDLKKYIEPTFISSISNVSSGVKIKWNPVPEAMGYHIYRKTASSDWKKVKTTFSTSWTDTIAKKNGTEYYYVVCAYSRDGVSEASLAEHIYFMSSPALNRLENTSKGKVTLNWSKNSKATGYQIKYMTGSSSKVISVDNYKTIKKVITNLKKGKTYKIWIRSYKEISGEQYYSAWSSVKSIKVEK